jgi:hypothetical protein
MLELVAFSEYALQRNVTMCDFDEQRNFVNYVVAAVHADPSGDTSVID